MTRDEILAEIDRQQQLLDQAVTAIEAGTAAKVAAEQQIADGEARRGAAQTELARLVELLANLPPERDWRVFGCRRTDLTEWSARIGLQPAVVQTFSNDDPFMAGRVTPRPPVDCPWLLQVTHPFNGRIVRGKTATLADVRAQRDGLRVIDAGQRDAQLRRGLRTMRGQLQPGDYVRVDNERWVNWFWYGSAPNPNAHITPAQATQVGGEIADAHRGADERLMALAFEEWGAEFYASITWDICGAGNLGDPFRWDLARREWPRTVPAGTRINLGTDAYVQARGDVNRLRANLAAVDMLAAELPNVVSISIDEWGPHSFLDDTAAELDALVPEKEAFVAETVRWMKADHPVPLVWVALYETVRPNGRATSTVLFADRDQRKPPANDPDDVIILRGRENAAFIAANGERVPSNDPEMAAALLAALAD